MRSTFSFFSLQATRGFFIGMTYVLAVACAVVCGASFSAIAAWDGTPYDPAETLDPECPPTHPDCRVDVPLGSFSTTTINAWLATKDTDDLPEGSANLYFTNTRAQGALTAGSGLVYAGGQFALSSSVLASLADAGTALQPGDNISLLTNDVGYLTDFTGLTADDLVEGTTNLYWTPTRFTNAIAGLTSDDIGEGATNLYFTNTRADARADARIGAATSTIRSVFNSGTGVVYNPATGAFSLDAAGDWTGTFDGFTSDYYLDRTNHTGTQTAATISDFTSAARGLLSSGSTGLLYNPSTGVISVASGYEIPTTASTTNWNTAYNWGDHASAGYLNNLAGLTADDLTEGTTNLYFTNSRADARADARIGAATSTIQSMFTAGTGLTYTGGEFALSPSVLASLADAGTALQPGDNISLLTNDAGYTSNTGTVTSVGLSVPTGLSVASSPITSSGTLSLSWAPGYVPVLSTSVANWDTAYGWGNHAAAGYLSSALTLDEVLDAGAIAVDKTTLYTTSLGDYVTGQDAYGFLATDDTNSSTLQHALGFRIDSEGFLRDIIGASLTDNRTVVFPDKSGTIAMLDDVTGGTVTSVGLSVPVGLTVSSSPITSSGTIGLGWAAGYTPVLSTSAANWDSAYGWGDHAAAGYLTDFTGLTADDLVEGTTNLYWTPTRFTNAIAGLTSDDIAEGTTNLYYSDARAQAALSAGTGLTYAGGEFALSPSVLASLADAGTALQPGDNISLLTNDAGYTTNTGTVTSVGLSVPTGLSVASSPITSSGTLSLTWAPGYVPVLSTSVANWDSAYGWGDHAAAGYLTDLAGLTTDDLAQGSTNLYFTDARARAALSAGTGLTYNSATGAFSLDANADWTGTIGGFTPDYYLNRENHTGSQSTSTIENFAAEVRNLFDSSVPGISYVSAVGMFTLEDGYVVPTTTATANWDTAYSWGDHAVAGYLTGLTGLTTDTLPEGSTNLYFTNTRARAALSTTAPGLSYNTSTGVLSLASGYTIPTTAATTNWNTAYGWGNHATAGYLTSVSTTTVRGMFSANAAISYNSGTGAFSLGTVGVAQGGTGSTTFTQGLVYAPGGTAALISTTTPTLASVTGGTLRSTNILQLDTEVSCNGLLQGLGTNASGRVECISLNIGISDERLKDEVGTLSSEEGLEIVRALRPVAYHWKDPSVFGDTDALQYGFMAQEVAEINPGLAEMTTNETSLTPKGTMRVNYLNLISPIVRAIQEIDSRLTAFAESFTTKKLCLEDVCITKNELKTLLEKPVPQRPSSSISIPVVPLPNPAPAPTPTPGPALPPEDSEMPVDENAEDGIDGEGGATNVASVTEDTSSDEPSTESPATIHTETVTTESNVD